MRPLAVLMGFVGMRLSPLAMLLGIVVIAALVGLGRRVMGTGGVGVVLGRALVVLDRRVLLALSLIAFAHAELL